MLPSNTIFAYILFLFSMMGFFSLINSFNLTKVKMQKSKDLNIQKKSLKYFSLFVSFDPKSSMSFLGLKEMNWLISLIILSLCFYSFWTFPNRMQIFLSKLIFNLSQQFSIALKTKKDGSTSFFVSLFILFVFTNFMGLFPNIFTSSSHLTFNLFSSFSMWTGFLIYGWLIFTNKMLAHLVPLSTPKPLISFMVLIELISTVIRPGTLAIRLMANMVSGHLLLTLMGNSMVLAPILMTLLILMMQCILSMLEVGVSMIQAYVFCMLLSLYSDESDYNK